MVYSGKKTPTFKDSPMTGILSEIRGLENRKDPTTYSPLYTAVTSAIIYTPLIS